MNSSIMIYYMVGIDGIERSQYLTCLYPEVFFAGVRSPDKDSYWYKNRYPDRVDSRNYDAPKKNFHSYNSQPLQN
jgi:hypothetical protein